MTPTTSILFLMCGLPASGKTTMAKELELEYGALRLTPDEWMEKIVGNGFDEQKRSIIEDIMINIAKKVLLHGVNVVLDFGFWSREERLALSILAEKIGVTFKICYLDVEEEELYKRLEKRNAKLPDNTFFITTEQMNLYINLFEKPTNDELKAAN